VAWGLVRGNNAGWSSFEVEASLVIGVLLLVAFIGWEVRARVPMVPMRFFRSRVFSASNAIGFLLFASLYGNNFFLAQFLQAAQGYGPLASGLRLLPSTAMLFVIASISGSLVNRLGERSLIVGGLLLQAGGLAWIAFIARPDLIYTGLVVPLIVAGIGVSMAMPAAQTAVVSAVAPNEIGKASGIFNMLRFLGGVFGVAIPAAVFAGVGGYGSPQAFSHGFVPAMGAGEIRQTS
jgi:predicted MFS family arabinose efflux permease